MLELNLKIGWGHLLLVFFFLGGAGLVAWSMYDLVIAPTAGPEAKNALITGGCTLIGALVGGFFAAGGAWVSSASHARLEARKRMELERLSVAKLCTYFEPKCAHLSMVLAGGVYDTEVKPQEIIQNMHDLPILFDVNIYDFPREVPLSVNDYEAFTLLKEGWSQLIRERGFLILKLPLESCTIVTSDHPLASTIIRWLESVARFALSAAFYVPQLRKSHKLPNGKYLLEEGADRAWHVYCLTRQSLGNERELIMEQIYQAIKHGYSLGPDRNSIVASDGITEKEII